ncbi:MAG: MarC family protein [Polyangiales bacterium]
MLGGLAFLKTSFPSIFSIVDPIAALPAFLALTGHYSRAEQRSIAFRSTVTLIIVLCTFAATGTAIFHFFGITVPAFKVAGGILLFWTALDMIQAKHQRARTTPEEKHEAESKSDVAVIPIGIPLLSGPGAIATVTVLAARAHGPAEKAAIYASILMVAALTFVTFFFAYGLVRLLRQTGINIASRIMGLILAATAAQFVLDGWHEAEAMFRAAGG